MVERALRKRTVVGSIPTGGLLFVCLMVYFFGKFADSATKWNRRGLNPGPSACKADVIPLHHIPIFDDDDEL